MILPPFFGISIPKDEDIVRQAVIDYMALDTVSFLNPFPGANITFHQIDVISLASPTTTANITYNAFDALSLPALSNGANLTFNGVDVLYWRPPPELPLIPEFLSWMLGDEYIDLSWSEPYDNRCDITEYVLEYSDCFLSYITSENEDNITTENSDKFIEEFYNTDCNWQVYDKKKILTELSDRVQTNNELFIITEKSSGIGDTTSASVDELVNDTAYLFRVAAVNCVGIGDYAYSEILTPFGTNHVYCDISLFLQPNSNDIIASLYDHSCGNKSVNYLAGVSTSTSVSKFGGGSLYFNGAYEGPPFTPDPGTYSHLYAEANYSEEWSLHGDFTIELWIRPDSSYSSSYQTLVSAYSQDPNNSNYSFWKLYRYQNQIRFQMSNEIYDDNISNSIDMYTANDLSLSTTDFTHICVCRSVGDIRIFVDGIEKKKEYFNDDVTIVGDYVVIGADQTSYYIDSDYNNIGRYAVGQPYIGYIDDIMLSRSARYRKSFVPEKYAESADCEDCGGYSSAASISKIDENFIP